MVGDETLTGIEKMASKAKTEIPEFVARTNEHELKFCDRRACIAGALKKHAKAASKAQEAFVVASRARRKFDDPNGRHHEKLELQSQIAACPERAVELADRLARHREIWESERLNSKEPVFEASRKLAALAVEFLKDAVRDITAALEAEALAWQSYNEGIAGIGGNAGRLESELGRQLRVFRDEITARLNVATEAAAKEQNLQSFKGGEFYFGPVELRWLENASGEGAK